MNLEALENKLKKHAQTVKDTIVAPFELNTNHKEVTYMKRPKMKRLAFVAALSAVCICTVAFTPLAGTIQGYFQDIKRLDGAVTGTAYQNATHEVHMGISENGENGGTAIPLTISFENKTKAPFAYIQEIAITAYTILDQDQNEVLTRTFALTDAPKGTLADGETEILLPAENALQTGTEYTVFINTVYGLSKADAPLVIYGTWNCTFVR